MTGKTTAGLANIRGVVRVSVHYLRELRDLGAEVRAEIIGRAAAQ